MPAFSHKAELRLAAHLEDGSSLSGRGESSLRGEVEEALRIAEDKGVEEIIAFATSAIREAKNGEEVLARIREQTGAQINVMTGHEEARLTFLAARRWFGWSSGRLLVIDIGGGSLEVATGIDEEPDAVASLPLGAGLLADPGQDLLAVLRLPDGRGRERDELLHPFVLRDAQRVLDHAQQMALALLGQPAPVVQLIREPELGLVREGWQGPGTLMGIDHQQVHGVRPDIQHPKSHALTLPCR